VNSISLSLGLSDLWTGRGVENMETKVVGPKVSVNSQMAVVTPEGNVQNVQICQCDRR